MALRRYKMVQGYSASVKRFFKRAMRRYMRRMNTNYLNEDADHKPMVSYNGYWD